ncbi:hypothetical protein [Kribbella sp. NPDC049584]|uniref:hypothetical protein n=1 Tax=Kribbella sp. NPDC049584 TaxID=3154833 RepID=UPI0034140617
MSSVESPRYDASLCASDQPPPYNTNLRLAVARAPYLRRTAWTSGVPVNPRRAARTPAYGENLRRTA